jgi:hypothetical protein
MEPTNPPTEVPSLAPSVAPHCDPCYDLIPEGAERWYDAYGEEYTCDFYEGTNPSDTWRF